MGIMKRRNTANVGMGEDHRSSHFASIREGYMLFAHTAFILHMSFAHTAYLVLMICFENSTHRAYFVLISCFENFTHRAYLLLMICFENSLHTAYLLHISCFQSVFPGAIISIVYMYQQRNWSYPEQSYLSKHICLQSCCD